MLAKLAARPCAVALFGHGRTIASGAAEKFARKCLYDQANVGFVSEGPEAARVDFEYDTDIPGNGNQGHTYGTDLPEEQKRALVEYLKSL